MCLIDDVAFLHCSLDCVPECASLMIFLVYNGVNMRHTARTFPYKKNILAFSSVVSTEWPIWSYVIENERMERISNLSESIIFVSLPLPAHNLNGFYLLYGLHDWHICSGSIMGLVWFQEPHKKQCPLHWREGKGVGGGGGVCSVSLLPEDETFTYEVLQLHPSSSMLVVGFNHMIWSNWPSNGW